VPCPPLPLPPPAPYFLPPNLFPGTLDIAHADVTRAGTVVQRQDNAHEDGIWSVAWSNTTNVVATASVDNTVKTWSGDDLSPQHTCAGHHLGVISVAASADGATLASSSLDSHVRLWDLATGAEKKQFDAGPGACPRATASRLHPPLLSPHSLV
jgi:WD40 repeat protein